MIDPLIVRMYDIRGIAGKDLVPEVAEAVGRAFGTKVARAGGHRVAAGMDNRLSSSLLEEAAVAGLESAGMHVTRIGICPSPLLYFVVARWGLDGGIQVTASHNPAEYNGFKLVGPGASPVAGEELQELRKLIEKGDFVSGKGAVEERSPREEYMRELEGHIHLGRKLSVVVDAGNGVAGMFAPELLRRAGCEVQELYCELDGSFPNHAPDPEPEESTRELRRIVVESGADIGLAYDGDVDRVGVVDEKGQRYEGDSILVLLARDYLSRHAGAKVVFDVKASQNVERDIRKHGGVPVMWKTGHSLIKRKMKKDGIGLGGEVSGHFYIGEGYYGFDDALLASCKLLTMLSNQQRPFSELLLDLPRMHTTPEMKVGCSEQEKFNVAQAVGDHFRGLYDTVDLDGVRVNFPGGWALVRASNTSPVLSLRFEASSAEGLCRMKEEVYGKLREFDAVDARGLD